MNRAERDWFWVDGDIYMKPGLTKIQVCTWMRLQAYLNIRWRTSEITTEQAGEALLSPEDCRLITQFETRRQYEHALRSLEEFLPIRVTVADGGVGIAWPSFGEEQGYDEPNYGEDWHGDEAE